VSISQGGLVVLCYQQLRLSSDIAGPTASMSSSTGSGSSSRMAQGQLMVAGDKFSSLPRAALLCICRSRYSCLRL